MHSTFSQVPSVCFFIPSLIVFFSLIIGDLSYQNVLFYTMLHPGSDWEQNSALAIFSWTDDDDDDGRGGGYLPTRYHEISYSCARNVIPGCIFVDAPAFIHDLTLTLKLSTDCQSEPGCTYMLPLKSRLVKMSVWAKVLFLITFFMICFCVKIQFNP